MKISRLLAVLLICGLAAWGVRAGVAQQALQQDVQPRQAQPELIEPRAPGQVQPRLQEVELGQTLQASEIKGMKVMNPAGEDLGTINDLMIDVGQGKVRYAALAHGGLLGIGQKLFAVPYEALELYHDEAADERHFLLDVEKETLEQADGFDRDAWPQTGDEAMFGTAKQEFAPQPEQFQEP